MDELKGCGYFGCHVRNQGECECTQCSMTTGHCSTCNQFPNRVRKDIFLAEAMLEKCKMCRDVRGARSAGEYADQNTLRSAT